MMTNVKMNSFLTSHCLYSGIVFLMLFLFSPVHLWGAFEQRSVGARPIALGGAFVTGQDNVSSTFWNSSALTTLENKEFEFTYQDLHSKGLINYSHLGFGYPDIGPGTFGISWTRLGVSNKVPFNYSENTYTVAYGAEVLPQLSIGSAINFFRLNSTVDGSGIGLNIGILYQPLEFLVIGSQYHNVGQSSIRFDSGARDDLPQDFTIGSSFSYKDFKIYSDLGNLQDDPEYHMGFEYTTPNKLLQLRSGVRKSTKKEFSFAYAFGFGVMLRNIGVDYAYENHFDLGGSHIVTVSWKF